MNKVTFALENFRNIQELIRYIDQKAGALLVIYGFILAILIELAKNLTFINPFSVGITKLTLLSILSYMAGTILIILLLYQYVLHSI